MIAVRNSKELSPLFDGFIWRMTRIVAGKKYGIQVAVPSFEVECGRTAVAYRLMRARRELAQAIFKDKIHKDE